MEITVLLIIVGIILFFVFGRELVCWYLKITENVNELKENNRHLKEIIKNQKKIIDELKNN